MTFREIVIAISQQIAALFNAIADFRIPFDQLGEWIKVALAIGGVCFLIYIAIGVLFQFLRGMLRAFMKLKNRLSSAKAQQQKLS